MEGKPVALLVTEIFYSIQGESIWSGLPCALIRLSGCNLRCHYCDTPYAYEPGQPMTVEEIMDRVDRYQCPRLTVTGGEPLLQKETPGLVSMLIEKGYRVSVETNGSLNIEDLDLRCVKILDVKCPSSGMQVHNRMENLRLLGPEDQIKFVIADQDDFDFSLAIAKRLSSEVEADRIWFSPVSGILPAERLAGWMLDAKAHGRLQLQLHKILWPDKDRGV
jgi:7-carboxy-7-deazaguanine synthase